MGDMSMKIPNKIYTSIYKARTARIAKQKTLSSRMKTTTTAKSSASRTSGATRAQSYLNQLTGKNNSSVIEKLAQNSSDQLFYSRMQTAAGQVKSSAEKLLKTGENSIFEQEDTAKAKEQATEEIENFVNDYNIMMGRLNSSSDNTDTTYRKKLQDIATAGKKELEKVGITIGKNGTLSLDDKKLKEAELADEKSLFYTKGCLGEKVKTVSDLVYKHAKEKVQTLEKESYSLSANYTRYGTSANQSTKGYFNRKA